MVARSKMKIGNLNRIDKPMVLAPVDIGSDVNHESITPLVIPGK